MQYETGIRDIDETIGFMRDNLHAKGVENGEELDAFLTGEKEKMRDELARNISGDFSAPYIEPDYDNIAKELSDCEPSESKCEISEELTAGIPEQDYNSSEDNAIEM